MRVCGECAGGEDPAMTVGPLGFEPVRKVGALPPALCIFAWRVGPSGRSVTPSAKPGSLSFGVGSNVKGGTHLAGLPSPPLCYHIEAPAATLARGCSIFSHRRSSAGRIVKSSHQNCCPSVALRSVKKRISLIVSASG